MTKNNLLKELQKQDPEELLRLLAEVAKRFPIAKTYLQLEFGMGSEEILQKYKKQLMKEYFPGSRPGKARGSRANKILKEFDNLVAFPEDSLELRFYQLELVGEYYCYYGYNTDPFINNLTQNWTLFCKLIRKHQAWESYEDKLEQLLDEKFSHSSLGRNLRLILEKRGLEAEE